MNESSLYIAVGQSCILYVKKKDGFIVIKEHQQDTILVKHQLNHKFNSLLQTVLLRHCGHC